MTIQEILDEINKISPSNEAYKAIPTSIDNYIENHFNREYFEKGFTAALENLKTKFENLKQSRL